MQKMLSTAVLTLLSAYPAAAQAAVTYDTDGAALLGDTTAGTSSNLIAAIGGANLSLACLGMVILMMATVYIFHEIWHPKRVHEKMTKEEVTQGSIRFYIGGCLVWMLIAVMAEAWCVILPLALILAAALVYYVITLSSLAIDTKFLEK